MLGLDVAGEVVLGRSAVRALVATVEQPVVLGALVVLERGERRRHKVAFFARIPDLLVKVLTMDAKGTRIPRRKVAVLAEQRLIAMRQLVRL